MGNVVGPYVDRITRVPGAFIDKGADVFTRIAERSGGTMMGRRLTARANNVAVSDDNGSATMTGDPPGAWAMREDGAKVHTIAPAGGGALAGGLRHPVSVPVRHPGFAGEHRWTDTVNQAETELSRLALDLANQAAS